jgi:Protein of unknown function (DUF4054)
MITPASFRVDFTEFASSVIYTNSSINYWINFANLFINPCLLGGPSTTVSNPPATLYDVAVELFVAHNLALEQPAQAAAANGGVPGVTTGPISSKHSGPISVSYAANLGVDPDDAQYNLTIYGTRFINLYKLAGAPGYVANGGGCGANYGPYPVFGVGCAWSGPPLYGVGPWM